MSVDWNDFLRRLNEYPAGTHLILPPCPSGQIQTLEQQLGPLPCELAEMLKHFNGAQLFNKNGPLVSIFGVTMTPPLSPLEWFPDWHLDKFTPVWRAKGHAQDEWPIAIMNYGVLIVLDARGITKEWDTGQHTWGDNELLLQDRLEALLREGDLFLSET